MSNEELLSREDRVRAALSTLSELGVSRGDSFDVGTEIAEYGALSGYESSGDPISQYLSNPKQLSQLFNLTEKQAENICSAITGGGAAAGHKLLARYFGAEFAGAIGGFFGGYISRKVVGK